MSKKSANRKAVNALRQIIRAARKYVEAEKEIEKEELYSRRAKDGCVKEK